MGPSGTNMWPVGTNMGHIGTDMDPVDDQYGALKGPGWGL